MVSNTNAITSGVEGIFDKDNGIPNKQKTREIASTISQYGMISKANVYNWFQNRRARCRRNQKRRLILPRRPVAGANKNDSGGTSNQKRWRTVIDTHLSDNPKGPRLEDQIEDSENTCSEVLFTDLDIDAAVAFLFSDDKHVVSEGLNPIVV